MMSSETRQRIIMSPLVVIILANLGRGMTGIQDLGEMAFVADPLPSKQGLTSSSCLSQRPGT